MKTQVLRKIFLTALFAVCIIACNVKPADAILLTDPDDARVWQGATVGTFASLYHGSNTLTNRQQVIDDQLLDDGIFDPTGYIAATLISAVGAGSPGYSTDLTGTGSYGYGLGGDVFTAANSIDNLWFQTDHVIGHTIFDLGFDAEKAAVFNTIDHGPLPQEAIESTIYLSNDKVAWTQAVVERVWLEGFMSNTGILWDGFTYAVGTGTTDTFRYASVIWGGDGALIADGDNEINGIMGLQGDFTGQPTGNPVPEPATMLLLGSGLTGMGFVRRRKKA